MKKRSILVAALVLLIATTALSQPMRMTPQARTDTLAKQLSLSDEQKAKVLDLLTKQDEARQKAFADAQGDRDAMRETMTKLREETNTKMKAILTKEQFEKYEKIQSEMRGGMGGRRPN